MATPPTVAGSSSPPEAMAGPSSQSRPGSSSLLRSPSSSQLQPMADSPSRSRPHIPLAFRPHTPPGFTPQTPSGSQPQSPLGRFHPANNSPLSQVATPPSTRVLGSPFDDKNLTPIMLHIELIIDTFQYCTWRTILWDMHSSYATFRRSIISLAQPRVEGYFAEDGENFAASRQITITHCLLGPEARVTKVDEILADNYEAVAKICSIGMGMCHCLKIEIKKVLEDRPELSRAPGVENVETSQMEAESIRPKEEVEAESIRPKQKRRSFMRLRSRTPSKPSATKKRKPREQIDGDRDEDEEVVRNAQIQMLGSNRKA